MASQSHLSKVESVESIAAVAVVAALTPTDEEATLPPNVPTLHAAFSTVREALAAYYEPDDLSAYLQLQELQMLYDNGGDQLGHQNHVTAWRHLLPYLEQALKQPLRIV